MAIKIGLIGAGDIARKHLDVLRDMKGLQAVGIVSRTESKARQVALDYGIPVCATEIATMVKEAKPDALMVLVSFEHMYEVTSRVIPLGLPLFIEKPPGLRPEETQELVQSAKANGVATMVGYNRRFYSIFHKGMDIIRKHGDLLGIRVEGHERFWKLADHLKEPVRGQWIYANNTHMIDLLRFFAGEPVAVSAVAKSRIEKNGDQFAAVLEFASGTIGHFGAHWYSPGGWGVVLYGQGVTVEFKPLENGRWTDQQFNTYEIQPDEVDVTYKAGFFAQLRAFGSMVKDGRLPWPGQDLESSYRTMLLAQAMVMGKIGTSPYFVQ